LLGNTALLIAARNGHVSTCIALLNEGASVYAVDLEGSSALHKAAENGHVDVCTVLIKRGSKINAGGGISTSDEGGCEEGAQTPLHEAAWNGHAQVCRLLLEKGADIHIENGAGLSPLEHAKESYCAKGGKKAAVIALLEMATGGDGALGGKSSAVARAKAPTKRARAVVPIKANIDNIKAAMAAAAAAVSAHQAATAAAPSVGEEVPKTTSSAAADAADAVSTEAVPSSAGVIKNNKDAQKQLPAPPDVGPALFRAAQNNKIEDLRVLCSTWKGNKVLDWQDLEADEDFNALLVASFFGYDECVKILLDAGASIHATTDLGEKTALHLAAQEGRISTCRLLIGAGANVRAVSAFGETPIMLAEENKRQAVVALLKEAMK